MPSYNPRYNFSKGVFQSNLFYTVLDQKQTFQVGLGFIRFNYYFTALFKLYAMLIVAHVRMLLVQFHLIGYVHVPCQTFKHV